MVRIVLGAVTGFLAWSIVGSEAKRFFGHLAGVVRRSSNRVRGGNSKWRSVHTGHDNSAHEYCPRCNCLGDVRISGRIDRRRKQPAATPRLSAGPLTY